MELVIVLVVFVAFVFGARALWLKADEFMPKKPVPTTSVAIRKDVPTTSVATRSSEPTKVTAAIPTAAFDLNTTKGVRSRIAGSDHWIDNSVLEKFNGTVFYLRREPDNEFDENAIAIYAGTRKVGYVRATQAAKYAPLLDLIGSEFAVTRDTSFYAGDEYFLPRIPALRQLAQDGAQIFDKLVHTTISTTRVALTVPPASITGGHQKFSGPHRNGDRLYGYSIGFSAQLLEKGTPLVSSLRLKGFDDAIRRVRVEDKMPFRIVGSEWVASLNGVDIGALPFSIAERGKPVRGFSGTNWDHDEGILHVTLIKVSSEGLVVNCGGVAYPVGHPNLI